MKKDRFVSDTALFKALSISAGLLLAGCAGYATVPMTTQSVPTTMDEALSPNLSAGDRAVMMNALPSVPHAFWRNTILLSDDKVYASSPELADSVEKYDQIRGAALNLYRGEKTGRIQIAPPDTSSGQISDDSPDVASSRKDASLVSSLPGASHTNTPTGIYFSEYAAPATISTRSDVNIPCATTKLYYSPISATVTYQNSNGSTSTATVYPYNEAGDIYTGLHTPSVELDIGFQMNPPTNVSVPPTAVGAVGTPTSVQVFSTPNNGAMYLVNDYTHIDCDRDIEYQLFPSVNPNATATQVTNNQTEAAQLDVSVDSMSSANPSPVLALLQPLPGSGYKATGCSSCKIKRVLSMAVAPLYPTQSSPAPGQPYKGIYRENSLIGVSNPLSLNGGKPQPTVSWINTGVSTGMGCAPITGPTSVSVSSGANPAPVSTTFPYSALSCPDFKVINANDYAFAPSTLLSSNILLLDANNYSGKNLTAGLNEIDTGRFH